MSHILINPPEERIAMLFSRSVTKYLAVMKSLSCFPGFTADK
ncbi:MAG: hypothetical protein U1F27_00250 [Turneriella sp.]